MTGKEPIVFSGAANYDLYNNICNYLRIKPRKPLTSKFSDQEIQIENIDESIRGEDVFVIQSTCSTSSDSINDNLMGLAIMLDAIVRAGAQKITAVMPYFGYARQDRKVKERQPITAQLVADILAIAGAGGILTIDLHSDQIEGFFKKPIKVDKLEAKPVILEDINSKYSGKDIVIVSPDAGGVKRAEKFSKVLNADIAIYIKNREKANEVKKLSPIIGDVDGKIAILVDDMIDTFGTMSLAVDDLLKQGAKKVVAYAIHGVLSGPAIDRIIKSPIEEVVITNTIPLPEDAKKSGKFRQLDVSSLLANAIDRVHRDLSVSALYL